MFHSLGNEQDSPALSSLANLLRQLLLVCQTLMCALAEIGGGRGGGGLSC